MAIKYVLLVLALVAATNAGVVVPAAAPVAAVVPAPVVAAKLEEFDPHPQYKYGYDVQDALSGDSKGHVEERDGDVVRGEYSLIDADGFRRTVTYVADPVNGFNAVVRREPLAVAAAPLVKAAPVVAAPAPIVKAAPVVAAPAPVVSAAPVPAAYAAPGFVYGRF